MIPPSPLQFTLWGSALYTELATGLWRALAAPWLQPGWPASACVPDRPRAPDPDPAARPAPAAAAAGARTFARHGEAQMSDPPLEAADRRVIEVPRDRWQHRRGHAQPPRTDR